MSESITMTPPTLAAQPALWTLLKEDLACVFQRDPAARSTIEVLTTYPGVHAILAHRISNRLWQAGWRYPARFLSFIGRLVTNVDIHPGATIGRRFFIDHGACVVVGETARAMNFSRKRTAIALRRSRPSKPSFRAATPRTPASAPDPSDHQAFRIAIA